MSDDKNKPAVSADALAAAIKQVSEQMIPAAIAAAVAATSKPVVQAPPPGPKRDQKCTECKQSLLTGCEGKHARMVVYPQRYPQHADYFPGAIINGVKYLSNDEGHRILVPEAAVGTIEGIVAAFEQNEQDMAVGRKAVRHSGTISPHGSSVSQADKAWR